MIFIDQLVIQTHTHIPLQYHRKELYNSNCVNTLYCHLELSLFEKGHQCHKTAEREYLFAEYILGIQGNNAHFLRIHSHNVNSVDHQ